ncbi:Pls/PosA family non-ribosomal peptide synthetase [Cellulomonas sp. S1-8]|uniref:Pls/PosA family non-ribosomal peptide synthetase n=1 Tax=Cellulomonas sp. S1-8 TaxID=2904790 RepID=UPI002243B599|nr:Pls/PosA family non-ribosomal peptide synthetase [Cellulomonas sp. S1-8]UZN02127.1 amino acid adenylation domain-containing protein [Cellulomonas sp. S1-8]
MTSSYLRGDQAPPVRTLLDVLDATVAAHPDAPALDDGRTVLTYDELAVQVRDGAARLVAEGVERGDRVGVHIPSGTAELYTAILAVLAAGAAYVPVDVDDPEERARTVFAEAGVVWVLEEGDLAPDPAERPGPARATPPPAPEPQDDAWVIFTSGSTGVPKGVAVRHRSAAAFVDAEARLFLQGAPLGPGDRVLAGLSVAFDASCEEMWLAWRHGACLVPAPRALVRTGMDLGPWLVAQRISVISTVPTLAGLWSADQLDGIRLLIFGGEACPPELVARLATPGRELWNTYGPTEATVVACAALLDGVGPVRIGHALDGWDLAVVGPDGVPVAEGGTGELVIGGVGLARYLDPALDTERFAPAPELGWDRAYRSGDLVRYEEAGLVFVGRADDQVKIGGRRIELGEVDSALGALAGVGAAAAAVRRTPAGTSVLVGYLAPLPGADVDLDAARVALRGVLPAALVPLLAVVDEIPTRGSGKVDRDALPWPLVGAPGAEPGPAVALDPTQEWVATCWTAALGAAVHGPDDDFFAAGGGSLAAAQLVSALRARYPTATVADVYEHPRLGDLARRLDELAPATPEAMHVPSPTPLRAQVVQVLLGLPLAVLVGLRWLTWTLGAASVLGFAGVAWAPSVPGAGWWFAAGWVLLVSPLGRMGSTVLVARTLLRGVAPGRYPRGGGVHLRLWFAESWAVAAGAGNLSCAPWNAAYARALGARVGAGVDLHALPPVTGHLVLGDRCAIEPEVDLSGHWLDGDVLHVGRVRVDKRATVGTRSVLGPGSRVGQGAEVAPGTSVTGSVPPGELWAGSPAVFEGPARKRWPRQRPPRGRRWLAVYGAGAGLLATLPLVALATGLVLVAGATRTAPDVAAAAVAALPLLPVGALASAAVLLVATWAAVRLLATGLRPGAYPVRSAQGVQAWATLRLMDDARTQLYPLYASSATPLWLRALGARVGRDVEASTVLLLPSMTRIGGGAFLADDTLIGSYELGGGYLRIEPASIGKRAFLGNSGMIAPGRAVPARGLVAVLSATPEHAKKGTSWLGSPPQRLRRVAGDAPDERTYAPPTRLRVARALVELCRFVPVVLSFTLAVAMLLVLAHVLDTRGVLVAALVSPVAVLTAAAGACTTAVLAKWALVGRIKPGEHPLWSSFVWRNELADTFAEVVAVPWLGPATLGSPALTWWLRALGVRIGRGAWLETYWLPEADLVEVGDGATVNRGCVLQTHLFHDRVMSLDTVRIGAGASLGPHGVVLPAAHLGAGASVGASSLVLRGDAVPAGSRWAGNPIAPA